MSVTGFLLAAGFGTRLRPLTLHRPKPLVPVCGVPMLDYALALLRQHGVTDVVANAHYLTDQVRDWASKQPTPVRVSDEQPDVLGTGGGLRFAQEQLGERIIIVNGDILCDVDLAALLESIDEDTDAVMALRVSSPEESYGVVAADESGHVVQLVSLAEAPAQGSVDRSTHFTGVHALHRRALSHLPEQGFSCIVRQGYVHMVPERRVRATRHAGTWFDVGTPAAYLRANQLAVAGELRLPLDPMPLAGFAQRGDERWGDPSSIQGLQGATLSGPVWIGAGATLEPGCRIGPRSVVGPGAHIRAGAQVEGSVIWADCEVPAAARLTGSVVHTGGVLELGSAAMGSNEDS